ncbi:cation/H(+) antiporter [Rhodospirillaceae bacterium KN72]|uniref:Cation/H(+) antiporter n=1 Tax=Pacificispira spongiicola TaxID=2729598 RepID=A0A7Y0HD35_9PROT|nr:cation:proton antiporter [Pacificispira spongiicola]NMM43220.1 cation/H(+) antiporter [Pacificispira spongiicola]
MHGASDLTGIVIVIVGAVFCGMAMVRLKQPAIIGYIFAGLLLGPNGLSLVENRETIDLLAQLGVIMLLFFVGMELSLRSFRTIWKVALVTAAAQIGLSVGALYILGALFEWPREWAILFGFCLALSSTAVAVKVLEDTGELRTHTGRIAVGILIAQDLAVAPMLVVISNMASEAEGAVMKMIVEVGLSVGILLALILFLTRRTKVNLPFHRLVGNSADLKPLAALALCFGVASVAGVVGLSPAFGAFLAGLTVGNSAQRQEVHENAGPIQAVLMMVFFLSIGLLLDLPFVWDNFGLLCGLLFFVTVFKTLLNAGILRAQGENWQCAFSVSLVIGQLGEFSFVMAAAAASTALIGSDIHKMIVALTVFSLMVSPVLFDFHRRIRHRAAGRISSVGGLLRFAYFREWQVTKQISRAVFAMVFRVSDWFYDRASGLRRHAAKKIRETRPSKTAVKAETAPEGGTSTEAPAKKASAKKPRATSPNPDAAKE